jgi:hypothetical protein
MACIISLVDPSTQNFVKSLKVYGTYAMAEEKVEALNKKLNKKPNKKELYWKVTNINV